MVASTENGLQRIMRLQKKYDMKFKVKETKMMKILKNENGLKMVIDEQVVQHVNKYEYQETWSSGKKDIRKYY